MAPFLVCKITVSFVHQPKHIVNETLLPVDDSLPHLSRHSPPLIEAFSSRIVDDRLLRYLYYTDTQGLHPIAQGFMSLLELEELGYSSHGLWPRNVNANEFLPDGKSTNSKPLYSDLFGLG